MRAWDSIESLSVDNGISTRSGYRWLASKKVTKKREGGRTLYVLNTDDDVDKSKAASGDGHDASRKRIAPTPQLAERTEAADLIEEDVRRRKAELELESLTPQAEDSSVKEERASLKKLQLSVEKIKAQKELNVLMSGENELQRRANFRARIEAVKRFIIPEPLKRQLPPDILLATYDALSRGLSELPDSVSNEDLILYSNLILNHLWNQKDIYPSIRSAKLRMVFDGIHSMWEWERQAYNAQHGNIFPTLESFISFSLLSMPVKQAVAIVQGINELSSVAGIRV
jgi:hypothetical protein